jgi:hypothetical protein
VLAHHDWVRSGLLMLMKHACVRCRLLMLIHHHHLLLLLVVGDTNKLLRHHKHLLLRSLSIEISHQHIGLSLGFNTYSFTLESAVNRPGRSLCFSGQGFVSGFSSVRLLLTRLSKGLMSRYLLYLFFLLFSGDCCCCWWSLTSYSRLSYFHSLNLVLKPFILLLHHIKLSLE